MEAAAAASIGSDSASGGFSRRSSSPSTAPNSTCRQAAWRHLLFGALLGELERRLNPPEAELEPVDAAAAASNGHGSVEHLVVTGP